MASVRDRRGIVVNLGACLPSAGCLGLGTGLTPHPLFTWLALLPALALALRAPARTAALVVFTAWLLGETNEWTYLTGQIGMPVGLVITFFLGFAAPAAGWTSPAPRVDCC